jgi:ribonuclease D
MRVDTFYPKAGLIQVGDGEHAYLIDPLLIGNWQPLAELLEDTAWSRCCTPAAKTSKCCCA